VSTRIRLLIDNAALDGLLSWPTEIRARFSAGIASRRFVTYLAPETVAEVFSVGATQRAGQLQPLAALILATFNGRVLNHHFWRVLDEVKGRSPSPFLAGGMARRILENIHRVAAGESESDREWFEGGAELTRREKADDKRWRTGFQQMYRERDRFMEGPCALDEFIGTTTVRDLVMSRIEAICAEAGVTNPAHRASEILASRFAGMPALDRHMFLRVARLWWYTASSPEGRRAGDDAFDDALLEYLTELDVLVTPDRALTQFGRTVCSDKRIVSPDEFCGEYLRDGA